MSINPSAVFYGLSHKEVLQLANNLPNLRFIQARNHYSLDNLLTLLRACPKLQELDLSIWGILNDQTLKNILTTCPQLLSLVLNDCPMIQDFKAIPRLCLLLIELHVEHSDGIDYAIMSDLCQALKELRLLNVDNCPQIIPADRVNLGVKHKGRIEFDPVHIPPCPYTCFEKTKRKPSCYQNQSPRSTS